MVTPSESSPSLSILVCWQRPHCQMQAPNLIQRKASLRVICIGTSSMPSVRKNFAWMTLADHCSIVSPSSSSGSTFQSRSHIVRRATASVVANLRPIQLRGPEALVSSAILKSIRFLTYAERSDRIHLIFALPARGIELLWFREVSLVIFSTNKHASSECQDAKVGPLTKPDSVYDDLLIMK